MQNPLVKNASDPDQVRNASNRLLNGREKELEDIRMILSTVSGRRFIWRYLDKCGLFKTSWHPSAQIHFLEGKRSVALELMADIVEADQNSFIKLMSESQMGGLL